MTNANIAIPMRVHQRMKDVQYARILAEGYDVKLSRIYLEAALYYLKAHPQQALLKNKALKTRMAG